MPASTSTSTSTPSTEPAFKFEVSAPKVFHFLLQATSDKIAVDAGALSYNKAVTVPIPKVVQSTASTAYGFALPYAQWGYGKVCALTGCAPVTKPTEKTK